MSCRPLAIAFASSDERIGNGLQTTCDSTPRVTSRRYK